MEHQPSSSRGSASNTVFNAMHQAIEDGTWQPGEKIPSENKLAAQYHVSRVTVRAAIQRLVSLGLLKSHQGSGTYVQGTKEHSQFDALMAQYLDGSDNLYDALEFYATLKTSSAALAAQRASNDDVDKMRQVRQLMEGSQNAAEIAKYDLQFHQVIVEATGNPMFTKLFEGLLKTYPVLSKIDANVTGDAAAKYHDMLIRAVQLRDSELARCLMIYYLEDTLAKDSSNAPIRKFRFIAEERQEKVKE